MASLDSLPADLRAVLQLVLQRGRSYGEIARMLSIDGDAVRERARAALDQLGPQTGVEPQARAQISDYLLGQLPSSEAATVRDRLADSPAQRAWARVVASELAPMASEPLPEIPSERSRRSEDHDGVAAALVAAAAAETAEPAATPAELAATPGEPAATPSAGERAPEPTPERAPEPAATATTAAAAESASGRPGTPRRPASRKGGAILLGAGLLIVVVVVAVVLLVSGGSSKKNTSSTAASASSTATTSTATSSTGSASARPIAQVNLTSPTGKKTIGGVAVVVRQGNNVGLILRAQGVPANTKRDAYAVWLYNSPSDSHILGFVNPGVKSNGVLQTAGVLPANASHFKQLLVSLETTGKPKTPSKIVLQGALNISG